MSEFGTGLKRAGFRELAERDRQRTNSWGQRTTARRLDIYTFGLRRVKGRKREFLIVLRWQAHTEKRDKRQSIVATQLLRSQPKYIYQGLSALLVPFWVIGSDPWTGARGRGGSRW